MADETTTTPHGTTIVGDKDKAAQMGGGAAEGSTNATGHTPQPAGGPRPGGGNTEGGAINTSPEPKGGMGTNQ